MCKVKIEIIISNAKVSHDMANFNSLVLLLLGVSSVVSSSFVSTTEHVLAATHRRQSRSAKMCALQCSSEFLTKVSTVLTSAASNSTNKDATQFALGGTNMLQREIIVQICKGYHRVNQCMRGCDLHKTILSSVLKGYAATKFLCVDKLDELDKYAECLSSPSLATPSSHCSRSCGGVDASVNALVGIQKGGSLNDISELGDYLHPICHFSSCTNECMAPHYTRVCDDANAARFMQEYTLIGLESIAAPLTDIGIVVPESCRAYETKMEEVEKENHTAKKLMGSTMPTVENRANGVTSWNMAVVTSTVVCLATLLR